jgi:hypothetical protein
LAAWLWAAPAAALALLLSGFCIFFFTRRRKESEFSADTHEADETFSHLDDEEGRSHEYWNPLDGEAASCNTGELGDATFDSGDYETQLDDNRTLFDGHVVLSDPSVGVDGDQDLTLPGRSDPGSRE